MDNLFAATCASSFHEIYGISTGYQGFSRVATSSVYGVVDLLWNQWTASTGTSGRFPLESVVSLEWNGWTL